MARLALPRPALRTALVLVAAALLPLPLLLAADDGASRWLAAHQSLWLDPLLNRAMRFGDDAAPAIVAAVLLMASVAFDRPRWRGLAVQVLLSALLAGLLVIVLKPLVGRHEAGQATARFSATWIEQRWGRFPSGHASTAFAIAASLAIEEPLLALPAAAFALLTASERLLNGKHLLSDVYVGAVLGIGAALWVASRRRARAARRGDAAASASREGAWRSETARAVALILLICGPLFFSELGKAAFFDPDEGRYATISQEMLQRGDLVTPTLDSVHYFEKPPLLYWVVAGAFKVFGPKEGAARAVPALSALAGVGLVWWLGRRMFSHRAGLLAAVVLATSLEWVVLAHELLIDMLFSVLVVAALACWWAGHTSGRPARWHAAFWSALALAVLAKGPVALVLVGGTLGAYALLAGRLRALLQPSLLLTAPLLPLIAAPWFVLVAQRNPAFDHIFWYQQHVARFLGSDGLSQHEQWPGYFVSSLPVLFFPWSFLLPAAAASSWRTLLPARSERQRAVLFLLCGAVVITLFFELSTSKLLTYVLPVLPLLALLLGAHLDGLWARRPAAFGRGLRAGVWLLVALLLLGAVGGVALASRLLRVDEARGPTIAIVFGLLCWGWAAALGWACRRRDAARLIATLASGSAVLLLTGLQATELVAPNHTVKSLIDYVRPGLHTGADLITYDSYLPGIVFYAGHRVVSIDHRGELGPGVDQLPPEEVARWFPEGLDVAREALASDRPVYCFVRDHRRAQELLPQLGDGVQEIIWNKRRSIVGNRAAAALTPPQPGGLRALEDQR
jgi:4-amino-4-deoxy-L-arabinose transferase-like glycosyltransferase/membrane-associated phospholipid phosphatase